MVCLPGHEQHPPDDATEGQKANFRSKQLNENPALAAAYFRRRFKLFLAKVMTPSLDIVDHWFRFEWQHRGSSHVHGFAWLRHAPDPTKLDLDDPASIEAFLRFWEPKVSAWHPSPGPGAPHGPGVPAAAQHPSSRTFESLLYTQLELAEMINRVQRHTQCKPGYCLKKRPNGETTCRFHFPRDPRALSEIIKDDQGMVRLHPARNDPLLNHFSPLWLLAWRANIDFGVLTDPRAAINYVAKYATKEEKGSEAYKDICSKVVEALDEETPARVAIQKILGKFLVERDISGQEACHALLDEPFYSASRGFTVLTVGLDQSEPLEVLEEGENGRRRARSWRMEYEERSAAHLPDVSLLDIYKS